MQLIEILGYAASAASGGAFLPQAIRALRTRQTHDLSLTAVALGAVRTVLWSAYGVAIGKRACDDFQLDRYAVCNGDTLHEAPTGLTVSESFSNFGQSFG